MVVVSFDKVKEPWAKLLVGVNSVVVRDPLVERKVDVVGSIDLLVLEDRHRPLEVTGVATNCFIDECSAVSEKEALVFQAVFPQLEDCDLESSVGLISACRHNDEIASVA